MRAGGLFTMVIALLVFLVVGVLVAVTPGAALGFGLVAVSRRMHLALRIALLLLLAAGSSVAWGVTVGAANVWRPAIMTLSFGATLASGLVCLLREAGRRRALRRPPVVWPGYHPQA
ncbi:hypothetical protein [Streptomyces sp. NPDC091268]|uniref:hypothetical protein n=1 Tax=Streptomyces sp. NPDC091268 TaxID=3365979 RepID=UPI0038049892